MPVLIPRKKFLKDLEKFRPNKAMRKKIAKSLTWLEENPHHPGLNIERIVNDPAAWSFRVDHRTRISFEPERVLDSGAPDWTSSIFLLRFLDHDDLYKSPR
jgi:hypothetical protein